MQEDRPDRDQDRVLDARLRAVAEGFDGTGVGPLLDWQRAAAGHIHESLVARHAGAAGASPVRRVYQCINRRVFPDPLAVVANAERVTRHLRARLVAAGVPHPERRCLRLIPSRDGGHHVLDADGEVWRCSVFIEGTRSHAVAETPGVAREASRVFGRFAALLADLAPDELAVTIPHFHDLPHRLKQLADAERADARSRAGALAGDLDATRETALRISEALAELGPLPRRSVHNDCKLDNALLDAETGEGLCAIDLDTCMAGDLLCDFGDLVRTATCPAPEDERTLERVVFDLERFEAVAQGYLQGLDGALGDEERAGLVLAGPLLALENAARFLADHLAGDVYFRIAREGQNLDRARAQRTLAERMLAQRADAERRLARAG